MAGSFGALVGKPTAILKNRASPRLVDSATSVGVEIEIEHFNPAITIPENVTAYWTTHQDGSLRASPNGFVGMEFVFTQPLFGLDAVDAVDSFCAFAARHPFKSTQRTGIHVHLDVRDLDIEELKCLCVLYALTEKLLYNWIGDNREDNNFCLPWYSASVDLPKIARALKSTAADARLILRDVHKYSALNFNSTVKYGSIEFRHMKTTFDKERIIKWINLILSLKRSAVAYTRSVGVEELAQYAMKIGPYNFALEVFGEHLPAIWYQKYLVDIYEYGLASSEELLKEWIVEEKVSAELSFTSSYKAIVARKRDGIAGGNPGIKKFFSGKKAPPPVKKKASKFEPGMVRMDDEIAEGSRFTLERGVFVAENPIPPVAATFRRWVVEDDVYGDLGGARNS